MPPPKGIQGDSPFCVLDLVRFIAPMEGPRWVYDTLDLAL